MVFRKGLYHIINIECDVHRTLEVVPASGSAYRGTRLYDLPADTTSCTQCASHSFYSYHTSCQSRFEGAGGKTHEIWTKISHDLLSHGFVTISGRLWQNRNKCLKPIYPESRISRHIIIASSYRVLDKRRTKRRICYLFNFSGLKAESVVFCTVNRLIVSRIISRPQLQSAVRWNEINSSWIN